VQFFYIIYQLSNDDDDLILNIINFSDEIILNDSKMNYILLSTRFTNLIGMLIGFLHVEIP